MSEEMELKYDTDKHEIDADTLIRSLTHDIIILQGIRKKIAPSSDITIKIKAITPASFHLYLLLENAPALATVAPLFLADLNSIIKAFKAVFKIKQFLEGKPPIKIIEDNKKNNILLFNSAGTSITVNNNIYVAYKDPLINSEIAQKIEDLKDDPAVRGFQIKSEDEASNISIPADKFEALSNPELVQQNRQIKKEKKVIISIFKLVFDQKRKWEFYYDGVKISAIIKDENFFKRIEAGEKFAHGDSLVVDLEIESIILDEKLKTYINESYTITKVYDHIPRSEQKSLNE